jgi:hypothetical protein
MEVSRRTALPWGLAARYRAEWPRAKKNASRGLKNRSPA